MIRVRIRVDWELEGDLQAVLGSPMAAQRGCGARWRDRTRQEALADWAGASLRGRSVDRMTGQWQKGAVKLGVEWLAAGSGRG